LDSIDGLDDADATRTTDTTPGRQRQRQSRNGGNDDDDDDEEAALRGEMESLEVDESDANGASSSSSHGRMRSRLSKSLTSFTRRFTGLRKHLHLPRSWFTWPQIPEEYKPRWFVMARLAGLFVIISMVYLLVVLEVVPYSPTSMFSPESVRAFAQSSISDSRIRDHVHRLSSYGHTAGSAGDLYLARWVEAMMDSSTIRKVQSTE